MPVEEEWMPVEAETDENQDAYETEGKGDDYAEMSGGALGFDGGGEAPLAEEIPDADAQVEGGGKNTDGGEEEEVRIGRSVRLRRRWICRG